MAEQGVHVRGGTPFDRVRARGTDGVPKPLEPSRDYSSRAGPGSTSMRIPATPGVGSFPDGSRAEPVLA